MNETTTRQPTGPTVGQVLRRAQDYLARHGVQEPSASAELLLAHVLGTDRTGLALRTRILAPGEAKAFGRALCSRCSGTPVQHLTGEAGFRRLLLTVRPGVFIPRPETEVLVERVLELLRDVPDPRVVDVGTGSGAIALSIKDERPDARVVAMDRSPEAVDLALENAARLGLDLKVLQSDLLAGSAGLEGPFDAVVSNPPYVSASGYERVSVDVKADPHEAVVGDLGVYVELASQAASRLVPGGILAVEIDDTMGREVCEAILTGGFVDATLTKDLAGRDRVVTARRGLRPMTA
jgi:release factor glutamine methyltransferase